MTIVRPREEPLCRLSRHPAAITPGVMMYTAGAQCTANFVCTDTAGNVYSPQP